MRYEIRPLAIYEHKAGLRAEVCHSTDDAAAAKQYAEMHAQDWPDGLAIVDKQEQTVDTGADLLPLREFAQ